MLERVFLNLHMKYNRVIFNFLCYLNFLIWLVQKETDYFLRYQRSTNLLNCFSPHDRLLAVGWCQKVWHQQYLAWIIGQLLSQKHTTFRNELLVVIVLSTPQFTVVSFACLVLSGAFILLWILRTYWGANWCPLPSRVKSGSQSKSNNVWKKLKCYDKIPWQSNGQNSLTFFKVVWHESYG